MLLELKGVTETVNGMQVSICQECMGDLEEDGDTPPRFSLANSLWVGCVLWELSSLTFSEQLLIAQLYPRVFVFKLYPKSMGQRADGSTFQRGLRGNVSTFKLDHKGVASMVSGKLMPRPLSILASVISVTFIGYGTLPVNRLHNLFRVRRSMVLQVLLWLKRHNPKYYGDTEIDSECLQSLPEDDVPDEVLGVVRQSTDVGILDQESAGYLARDDIDVDGE